MRVVSLVPSWTETLLWAGVEVVGRTRYCIHPEAACEGIPLVGGTKKIDWDKVASVGPDLLLLDREENTLAIAEESDFPILVTSVQSIDSLPVELARLSEALRNKKLGELANQWKSIALLPIHRKPLQEFPGVVEWIRKPSEQCRQLLYLIWSSPWMTVSPHTFIGSMLDRLGYGEWLISAETKYPQITLEGFERSKTLLLCPTEPYPFAQNLDRIRKTGFPAALVDGEKFSWFGLRSLRFLQQELGEE